MIDEFFVSHLRNHKKISDITNEISIGIAPIVANDDGTQELLKDTYIWIQQYDEEDILDLDGESGITRYRFDCEICSTDVETAKKLGRRFKKYLQGSGGYNEPFGAIGCGNSVVVGEVLSIVVESKDEDYIPYNQFDNLEITVLAFDVTITADDSIDDLLN